MFRVLIVQQGVILSQMKSKLSGVQILLGRQSVTLQNHLPGLIPNLLSVYHKMSFSSKDFIEDGTLKSFHAQRRIKESVI